jgi:hypothetical protein
MIVSAISATMMAPDAQQHLPMLDALLKTVVSQVQKAGPQQGAPGQQPPGAGGQPPGGGGMGGMGGGTNIQSLMGGGGQGGPAGPSQPSPSGISSDDLRRQVAASAGTPG